MKQYYYFLSFLFLLICCITTSSCAIAGNSVAAFRGIEFGSTVSALGDAKKLVLVSQTNNDKTYRRKTDKLALGEVKLLDIHYIFFHNRLTFVQLLAKNSDLEKLVYICDAKYGESNKFRVNKFLNNYTWTDRHEKGTMPQNLLVTLEEYKLDNLIKITLSDFKLVEKMIKAEDEKEKEKAKKAVDDF